MTEIIEKNEISHYPILGHVGEQHVEIFDPRKDRFVSVKRRAITKIKADVYERWVANVIVPKHLCDEIVEAPFLEPLLVNGSAVLSLCAIFMRHGAPGWVPLQLGPASHNCALRVACTDKRDGTDAVWVDHRYTDSMYAAVMDLFDFPKIFPYLQVRRCDDGKNEALSLDCSNGALALEMDNNHQRRTSRLFDNAQVFGDYFNAGVRSYGPGKEQSFAVVDLHKQGNPQFIELEDWRGVLDTLIGRWHCESIYRTENQMYEWEFLGYCDEQGDFLS